jgi:hypothetical protein
MSYVVGVVVLFLIYLSIVKLWIRIVEGLNDSTEYYFRKLLNFITSNRNRKS